jgi:DNA-binding transcriptional MerR regulator
MHPGVDSRVKGRLKIGEVAKRAGVRVDTVRYYDRQGLLRAVARSPSGYRQFSASAVERIRFIKQAQSFGFTLDELAEILRAIDAGKVSYTRGHARLLAVAARVDAKIAELRAVRRQLSTMLKRFAAGYCEGMEAASRAIRSP